MVVLGDADLERAAEAAVRDCFSNSGQLCISMERIYVVESAYDGFLDRFLDRVRAMRLGGDLDFGPDMGSLISAAQLDRVSAHVQDAVAKSATVLAGGRARPDIGPYFYEPTVLADVTEEMDLCRAETFGPVVSVRAVRNAAEAIRMANDSAYGLNASVWTRDVRRGRAVAARIETGTVSINETYAAVWGATRSPMGGVKDSGLGRRHGRDGILKYTEPQTVAVQRLAGFSPPPGVSWDTWARGFTVSLKVLKALGRR
jgi:succinate-semialdehyde dehydrogenase/glutarate-semialdehyde dehydrogenase